MIIAGPDSSPLTPRKWEQHQTLALAKSCDIGSLSSGFLNWPGPRGTWPLEFLADIAVLESDSAPLGSQTPASETPLTQPLSDITPTALRAKSLGPDTCRGAVEYLGFCAELGGPPPDLRHQFGPAAGT